MNPSLNFPTLISMYRKCSIVVVWVLGCVLNFDKSTGTVVVWFIYSVENKVGDSEFCNFWVIVKGKLQLESTAKGVNISIWVEGKMGMSF